MTELTDPYAIALKQISEDLLKGDMALLGVIQELIKKLTALEAHVDIIESRVMNMQNKISVMRTQIDTLIVNSLEAQ